MQSIETGLKINLSSIWLEMLLSNYLVVSGLLARHTKAPLGNILSWYNR
jgi:hypothetical protein